MYGELTFRVLFIIHVKSVCDLIKLSYNIFDVPWDQMFEYKSNSSFANALGSLTFSSSISTCHDFATRKNKHFEFDEYCTGTLNNKNEKY